MTPPPTVSSNLIGRLLTWNTYALALLPVVPYNVNSLTIMSWLALALTYAFLYRKQLTLFSRQGLWLFGLFSGNFLLLALSMLYTQNPTEGVSTLEGSLSMLLFPFVFFLLPNPHLTSITTLKRTLTVFWASTSIVCLYLIYYYTKLNILYRFDSIDSFDNPFRIISEQVIDKHPTYLSLYLGLSLFVASYRITTKGKLWHKLLYVCSVPLFLFHLIALASRTPAITIFIGLAAVAFISIKSLKIRLTVLGIIIVSAFLLIRFTPSLYSRIEEVQHTRLAVPQGDQFNSTNLRIGILACSWKLIKEHPILGIGVGSDKIMLPQCYASFHTTGYSRIFYNTHNQYLNFWLLSGIVAILLFIASLVYTYTLAIKNHDHTLLFFIILTSAGFLTENILSRQAGIVFYYFLLCLIMAVCIHRSQNTTSENSVV